MDSTIEGRIDEKAMLENIDPYRSQSDQIGINDKQHVNKIIPQVDADCGSKPPSDDHKPEDGIQYNLTSEKFQCGDTQANKFSSSIAVIQSDSFQQKEESVPFQHNVSPTSENRESEQAPVVFNKNCDIFDSVESRPDDDDDDSRGNVCARTCLTYDRMKRQCLDTKNSTSSHKNNENGNHTVNKRKKTVPQKAMYHLQSSPADYKLESCWSEDKNLSRLQTPIVTSCQKMNGTSLETKSNGHSLGMKANKRCAETYLSSANLWPFSQGSSQKPDSGQLESGWLSAYYANLFFSSFPLMFQNNSSMFSYPFLPSFNSPLNTTTQQSRFGNSTTRKSSLTTKSESLNNKTSDKSQYCDVNALKTNSTKLNNSDSTPMRKFAGESSLPFWPHLRMEDSTPEMKRRFHHSQTANDLKALDLSKSSCNRKTRRTVNSRPSLDSVENDGTTLSTLHNSVFSEFMRSSILPKLTEGDSKDIGRDYCKSYNGSVDSIKNSYDPNPKSSAYPKSISSNSIGNIGSWMANDLLLQPPIMPALSFLKWSPEELSDYVEKIDGCTDTAKALRMRGISGSQLPMLTLDIMTQELGLSMASAQNLMNIVRNLLSTTIPGETL